MTSGMADSRPVFFFDIDNTLYSKGKQVQHMMGDLIDDYFMTKLSVSRQEALDLHMQYYQDYGLAIVGLVKHYGVDPLEYNSKVDDALPLDGVITADPELRQLLEEIDTTKVRLWLFTNAYINHGKRVVKLLEIDDLFEGITYCDYASKTFICKPDPAMFELAKREAGISSLEQCYLVDDSALNCRAAEELGWTTVHFVEPLAEPPSKPVAKHQIQSLHELKTLFPQFFKIPNGA